MKRSHNSSIRIWDNEREFWLFPWRILLETRRYVLHACPAELCTEWPRSSNRLVTQKKERLISTFRIIGKSRQNLSVRIEHWESRAEDILALVAVSPCPPILGKMTVVTQPMFGQASKLPLQLKGRMSSPSLTVAKRKAVTTRAAATGPGSPKPKPDLIQSVRQGCDNFLQVSSPPGGHVSTVP
jgi:hypothetical protein